MIFALLLSAQGRVRPLADVPFTLRGMHIYTMAKVNGQGPFPMNIDTGGWMVMGAGLAKKIDLKATSQVKVGGAGAGINNWGYATGVKVEIGGVEITGLDSGIDTNLTSNEAGIGPELFQRFTVEFDYDHMRLRLYKKGTVPTIKGSTSVPLRFQTDAMKPLIYVKVGKSGGWFMADTGGRRFVDSSAKLLAADSRRARSETPDSHDCGVWSGRTNLWPSGASPVGRFGQLPVKGDFGELFGYDEGDFGRSETVWVGRAAHFDAFQPGIRLCEFAPDINSQPPN